MDARTTGCMAVAVGLVVAGTLATGLLPATAASQAVAGGLIVAAFVVIYACLRD